MEPQSRSQSLFYTGPMERQTTFIAFWSEASGIYHYSSVHKMAASVAPGSPVE